MIMNKLYTSLIFLLFISFTSAKADFVGDSTTFQFTNAELFNTKNFG